MSDSLINAGNGNFPTFIKRLEITFKRLFHEQEDIDKLSLERGLPASVRNEIMSEIPLSVAIPEEYGGRGMSVKECLALLTTASYESLPLSLIFGINIALFLEPVAKYAQPQIKAGIFERFIHRQSMGGLMITEPDHGSDALNMKTFNKEFENKYQIKGVKHWQGLTGLADFWLVTSRNLLPNKELGRDIDFFICDVGAENKGINVEEYFDSLGLYMIPYGRNVLDLETPKENKLKPESTGIKMMLDILHRSRMQFPGMGMGFIKRMLDEAIHHCETRIVGASHLLAMDQVQFQLSRIQSAYTLCSAMCSRSSEISGIENDLSASGLEANSMKAVVTDLMQESAQLLVQLSGAKGYRITHIGGRGITDSRPFQIFEGSNEMLYSQIADTTCRMMKKEKKPNLLDFLKTHRLTFKAYTHFKKELNFVIDQVLSQRKQVDLGKIIGRIICTGYVIDLQEKGFRNDLVENCIAIIKQEVSGLIRSFEFDNTVKLISVYAENSSWIDFSK